MKIKDYKIHSEKELIKKLRKVILLNSEKTGKPIFVYKNTSIELKEIKTKDLVPLQLYQLKSTNRLVWNLHKIFQKKYKEDIFNMDGYYTYESENKKYAFIPPIIESVVNSKGKKQNVVIDGLHRMLLAKKLKKKTAKVVIVKNIPQKLILPAVPNAWEEMEIVEVVPKSEYKRKWLVSPEKGYLYYRNFQSVFQNVGQPRASNLDK
jgi:hypothetical protein